MAGRPFYARHDTTLFRAFLRSGAASEPRVIPPMTFGGVVRASHRARDFTIPFLKQCGVLGWSRLPVLLSGKII